MVGGDCGQDPMSQGSPGTLIRSYFPARFAQPSVHGGITQQDRLF